MIANAIRVLNCDLKFAGRKTTNDFMPLRFFGSLFRLYHTEFSARLVRNLDAWNFNQQVLV